MARLPSPGGDDNQWGDILNDFLDQSHTSTGGLKGSAISSAGGELTANKGAVNGYAPLDSTGKVPASNLPASGSVPNATTSSTGVIQLGGDLNGSGTSATAPVITNGAVTDAKVASNAAIAKSKLASLSIVDADVSAISESKVTNLTSDLSARELTANKDQANGYAGLDSNTLLKVSELPRAAGPVVNLGSVSGSVTCDLSQGIAFTATLTGNTTFSFSNWPSSGLVEPEIYTVQDSTGGHTITMSGVTWEPTGSPPTFSTSPNAINIIPVASFNGGTNVYGITGLSGPTGPVGPAGAAMLSFSMPGTISTTTGASRQYVEGSYTITSVRVSVGTAPTGSSIICDVKKNGTTIYTTQANRPTIAANSNTATANNPDITSLSAGDYLTVDIDQVGSTVAGSDLTVSITIH